MVVGAKVRTGLEVLVRVGRSVGVGVGAEVKAELIRSKVLK